jgi:hypothetical protein
MPRKPKFKVGDNVRVLRASTNEEHDLWMDGWVTSMNNVIGKVMTIEYVNRNGDNLYPKYRFKEIALNFPEFVLEKEIQGGDQLLFAFMKK